ncbi:MAG: hypothetical protein BRC26_03705 [Nanohaloarchaea archaeon QH_8_44_6]|nr:MAG: hypothetical protein BRC26_03705 [Nanohaloarchaea archaeon QH_8_44_6]
MSLFVLPENTIVRYLLFPAFFGYGLGPLCLYLSYNLYRRKSLASDLTETAIDALKPGTNAIRVRLESEPVITPVSEEKAALAKLIVSHAGYVNVFSSEDKIYYNNIWLGSKGSLNLEIDENSILSLPDFEFNFQMYHGSPFGDKSEAFERFEERKNISGFSRRTYRERFVPNGEEVTIIGNFGLKGNSITLESSDKAPIIIASRPLDQLVGYYGRRSRNYLLYGLGLILTPTVILVLNSVFM